ncbi:DUF3048 domain-containing protein [Heyndrickxia acidicola]|uniref:DUF3048 domain-containing protein n=1 Tax=Heyndrickxia acidicola TaxID=209389 RepID=A0ABU6MDB9_9BACI|nr:DUF3048 domain-containing protein [Heyndrickxia acidicola]MED1202654.1 DUF3048 domain-containing protein [Heyndrickxia acidicola]
MQNRYFVWIFTFLFMLSACSHKDPNAGQTKRANPSAKTAENHHAEKDFQFPLTGEKTGQESSSRAVAVMINNHTKARPQSGIAEADIVYEVLAEGNITRFLAIFQSEKPRNIGPVRSARDYFIRLAKGYDSFYVAHGYSPEAKKMLQQGFIDNINGIQYDGTLFKRWSARVAPHNSYITFQNIEKGAKLKHYEMSTPPAPLSFDSNKEIGELTGTDITKVKITYSQDQDYNPVFQYDASLKKFKRYSGGVQTVDLETKKPVLIDNLFIPVMEHKRIDSYGRLSINLTSGGKAYLVQRGKLREVEWQNDGGRILPYENGSPIKLIPGKTWISIIPDAGRVTYTK